MPSTRQTGNITCSRTFAHSLKPAPSPVDYSSPRKLNAKGGCCRSRPHVNADKTGNSYTIKISCLIFVVSLLPLAGKSLAKTSPSLSIVISPRPLAVDARATWVGARKCISCHKAIYRHWTATPHAKAFETLKREQAEADPACLRCHTTAYGNKEGFSDSKTTPHLAGVQCEACHGPASEHPVRKTGWSWIKADCPDCRVRRICMGCHTATHSPDFNLSGYLEKVHPVK